MEREVRPTAEVVLIILSIGVSATMMIVAAGLVMLTLVQPQRDLTAAIESVSRLMTIVIGVIVGYLAGLRRPSETR